MGHRTGQTDRDRQMKEDPEKGESETQAVYREYIFSFVTLRRKKCLLNVCARLVISMTLKIIMKLKSKCL